MNPALHTVECCLRVVGCYADIHVAGYLIDKCRASVHITSNSGTTALHYAALYGNLGTSLIAAKLSVIMIIVYYIGQQNNINRLTIGLQS